MSNPCDEQGEMPGCDYPDDDTIEAILRGRRPERDAFDPLVELARDVRSLTPRHAPAPSVELAGVLMAGFSTEKGDLLATAGSNVPGPAPQAAGLPKWRKKHNMVPLGFLSGLFSKIAAGACAGLVGVTAAGAAGALPGPAQDAVATVVEAVTPFQLPTDGADAAIGVQVGANSGSGGTGVSITTGAQGPGGAQAEAQTSSTAAPGSAATSAGAQAGKPTTANASTATNASSLVPNLPVPNLPNLGGLPGVGTVPIPACVKDIVDLNTGQPKVPLSQISPLVVSCVRTLLASSGASLPAGAGDCVNSILNMVASATPGSVPNLTGFDFKTCVPVDVTKCMSSVSGMVQGFMSGFGGFGSGSGIPGLSGINLAGCMPFNVDGCLSSVFNMVGNLPGLGLGGIPGLGAGTVPSVGSLNLASCVPFGSLSSIPGMPNLGGFLPF